MPRFTTLYSSSAGNSAIVEDAGRYLMIDIGGSCKATVQALEQLGLSPAGLRAILITHEHSDHIKGLRVFLKKNPVPVLAKRGTLQRLLQQGHLHQHAHFVQLGDATVEVDGFVVNAFATPHDAADSCGFRVKTPSGALCSLATDLGQMTADVFSSLMDSSLVALEANYDPHMLSYGPYPPQLKARIASAKGHLSNPDAAAAVVQLANGGCSKVMLCHLSKENNSPMVVKDTVHNALQQSGLPIPDSFSLHVAKRYAPSDWLEF